LAGHHRSTTIEPAMSSPANHQRGVALLIVLWTLALLALLGSQVLTTSRQDTEIAHNQLSNSSLEWAADGAVQQAIWHVLDVSSNHWNADGLVRAIWVGPTSVAVRIDSEADKVNPAIASPALLQALVLEVGADPVAAAGLATSIVQWRLGSGPVARRTATFLRYQRAGLDYAPSGGSMDSIDELGAVIGMTPDLLARLRPHLTLFTDADPPITTRDMIVARALALAGQLTVEASDAGEQSISVTADARGPFGGRFIRRVAVRINVFPRGDRYEILARERLAAGQP
jgi:general secretion pathway protein K